ncbi:MAG: RIP metalloprotease RseP, partial [Proteobacteria bacterium]
MATIMSLFQSAVESIIPLTVLLGLLIFVHEMGHFLVAKYFKVRVEVFSLGFGPKLLKYQKGETVYAISAIPLGGYVKMFGDDPTATTENDQKAYSFTHKPVGQRIAIVLAGPLMNFFFAILIFAAVALLGEQAIAPKAGDIQPDSVAYAQGFRSGDTIKSVGGETVGTWEEMQNKIQASGDRTVAVEIERGSGAELKKETIQVTPKLADNKNPLSWDRVIGEVTGLTPSSRSTFIGVSNPKSLAGAAGLKTGDHVKKINGTELTKWRELRELLPAAVASGELKVEVERGLLDEKTSDNPETVTATV